MIAGATPPSPANPETFDVAVLGGGPAGHAAALTAHEAGKRVVLIESEHEVGGGCVSRGTIPSKTLRETAVSLVGFRRRSGDVFDVQMREDLQVASLMNRMQSVIEAHQGTMGKQLDRAGVVRWHGRARFADPHTIEVRGIDGSKRSARAEICAIATGSRPRTPPEIPVDHTNILDSDSFLSMIYLPKSLVVLGGGVIASEYAAIFASLGVKVTMIDKGPRPLGFLDPELSDRFVAAFRATGGEWLGGRKTSSVQWDGVSDVVVKLDDGNELRAEKLLCALGRVANLDSLNLAAAGLAATDRGLLQVDANLRTAVPHIYAIGDVMGPPSLASAATEQGRRAMSHAFGLTAGAGAAFWPMGIYTIPEIASVGLDEPQAKAKPAGALVGRADFSELARGQIAAIPDGLLKLVADATGRKLLGVQVIGEGAAELVHIGQMALIAGMDIDAFVANTFNFPTLAEAYRVAALDIVMQRASKPANVGA